MNPIDLRTFKKKYIRTGKTIRTFYNHAYSNITRTGKQLRTSSKTIGQKSALQTLLKED